MTQAEIDAFMSNKKDGKTIEEYDLETFGSVGPSAGYGGRRWPGRSHKRRRRKSRRKSKRKSTKKRRRKRRKSTKKKRRKRRY